MVKLLLGRTGADFLLLLEETDGAAHWQTRSWSEGGVPAALAAKLEKMRTKNHHVNEVSFGAAGEWFVHGVDAGGTSTFSWWDSAFAASRQLRKWTALPESRLHVAFGDEGRWLILQGHNGFCGAEHVATGLQKRIRKLHDAKGTIGVVRLLPGGAIFIGSRTPRAGSFPEASRSTSLPTRRGRSGPASEARSPPSLRAEATRSAARQASRASRLAKCSTSPSARTGRGSCCASTGSEPAPASPRRCASGSAVSTWSSARGAPRRTRTSGG